MPPGRLTSSPAFAPGFFVADRACATSWPEASGWNVMSVTREPPSGDEGDVPGRLQRARGHGRLAAKASAAGTRLDVLYQDGCAKIRLPKTFDGAMEAVLINTAGGLTGGDRIAWDLEARAGTRLTVTTQACERAYKAHASTATVETRIAAAAGARIDWLPQETILFDRAALSRRLEVDLAEDATLLAVEAILLGRKAMGERVESGFFRDRWRIRRAGRLIHAEETALAGGIAAMAGERAVLAGGRAFATVLFCGRTGEAHVEPLRRLLADGDGGVSHWQDKLVLRLVAPDGLALRKKLVPIISHLRGGAGVPKVWTL